MVGGGGGGGGGGGYLHMYHSGIRRYGGVLDLELSQGILRQDCIP